MSTSNGSLHRSASQRELDRLRGELAQFQLMAQEFGAILNYMIATFGQNDTIVIDREAMLKLKLKPIKTEFVTSPLTKKITGQRYTHFTPDQPKEKSLIILP